MAAHPEDEPGSALPESQEEWALRALRNIFAGADLTDETMTLANVFTDRQVGRLKVRVAPTQTPFGRRPSLIANGLSADQALGDVG